LLVCSDPALPDGDPSSPRDRENFDSSSSSKAELKVLSMAKQEADKSKSKSQGSDKDKHKAKPPKPDGGKEKKPPKAAKTPEAPAVVAAPVEKPPEVPRPPADPRLKFIKKFYGKFLPKGPLRERHKALMVRWNSGEEHGGVTVDELKSVFTDWKTARTKPARVVKV
jgi:hypothetical protein